MTGTTWRPPELARALERSAGWIRRHWPELVQQGMPAPLYEDTRGPVWSARAVMDWRDGARPAAAGPEAPTSAAPPLSTAEIDRWGNELDRRAVKLAGEAAE